MIFFGMYPSAYSANNLQFSTRNRFNQLVNVRDKPLGVSYIRDVGLSGIFISRDKSFRCFRGFFRILIATALIASGVQSIRRLPDLFRSVITSKVSLYRLMAQ